MKINLLKTGTRSAANGRAESIREYLERGNPPSMHLEGASAGFLRPAVCLEGPLRVPLSRHPLRGSAAFRLYEARPAEGLRGLDRGARNAAQDELPQRALVEALERLAVKGEATSRFLHQIPP